MAIATGVKGEARRRIVREHRRFMLDHALELLAQGKVSSDYVRLRGNKLKEIIGNGKS